MILLRLCITMTTLLVMASQLLAQQRMITGTVTDANSNTLLPYAVVYINNTSNATETDSMGKYQLRNAFYQQRGGSVELVVSSLGYTTFRQKITYGLQDTLILNIGLMPSPQTITEVAVKGKRDQKWLKQYKKFESTFIGTNQNAGTTKILNPWVIDFNGEVSAFSATAQNILEVENKALGYKVFFELQAFTVSYIRSSFSGLARFEKLKTTDEQQKEKWNENRQKAYEGSERHFFKALAQKRLKQEGFVAYEVNPKYNEKTSFSHLNPQLGKRLFPFNDTSAIKMGRFPSSKEIIAPSELEILNTNVINRIGSYQDAPFPVSWLRVKGGKTEVTTTGLLFDTNSCEWAGDIAERRIADMLPLDYEPEPLMENNNWKLFLPKNTPETQSKSALEPGPVPLVSIKHSFEGDTVLFRIQVKRPDGEPLRGRLSVAVIEDTQPAINQADTLLANPYLTDTSQVKRDPQAITLEEVKIKVKRNKRATQTLLGKVDYVVDSNDLKDIISGNVITALQHKVPGLDIFETTDQAGFSRKGIRIRGGGYSLRPTYGGRRRRTTLSLGRNPVWYFAKFEFYSDKRGIAD